MAGRRPIALAAVAVVLLLCLTGAAAADTQDVKGTDADDQFNAKAEFAMAAIAAVAPQHKSNPVHQAAAEQALKSAAAAEPQHAPQFPEDPQELQRKSQPATPTPADSPASKEAPKQQQPAATPSPAAAAPQKPEEQQQKKEEPKKEEPKKEEPKKEEPKKEEPKKEEPKKEEPKKEDICQRVPGCLECKPFDPTAKNTFGSEFTGGMRRLAQHKGGFDAGEWGASSIGTLGGAKTGKKGKPDFNFMQNVVESPYNAKDLPVCTSCNTTAGYVSHSRGRCACAAGYGDTTPSGSCHRCPNGFFSQGGFRAVCVECEGVAFSNADHTACVCASGWYGVTSFGTKQASCNQCPGTRPVSPEGARAVAECIACPEGQTPNEIFSECVDPTKIPPPAPEEAPRTPFNLTKAPDVQPLFNESTFANAKKDWIMTTRNTQNHSNIFSDFLGSIMDSVVMGKNISSTAARPGDLLYQVLTKPTAAPAKLPTLPNIDVQNPAAIGAGFGAALSTVPAVLGAAAQNGGKISDVVDSVVKAVETGSKAAGADMAGAGAGGNGWEAFVKGLAATAPKDGSGKSEVADFAKSLGDLFGAAGKAASQVAEKSDNSLVKSISGLLSAAKKGDIEVPLSGEAALIAAPDPTPAAPAEAPNGWGSMLQGLMGGSSTAAAPATPAAAAPAAGTDWSKLLSGFAKAATPTPAAAAPATSGINNMQQVISGLLSAQQAAAAAGTPGPSASNTDITKLLSGLTSPTARKVNTGRPQHTITTEGVHYVSPTAGSEQQPSTGVLPGANSVNVPDIMSALAKLGGQTKEVSNVDGDILEHTQQVIRGSSGDKAAGGSAEAIANMLGGLFGGQKSSTISFSNGMGSKVRPLQATQATAPADGFISVPSAPPKGSAAIKSGKFFGPKGNGMHSKAKKQQ